MDMRGAPEIPQQVRSFELPDVPYAVIPEIAFLEECEVQRLKIRLDQFQGLVGIHRPERREQILEHAPYESALIPCQIADADARQRLASTGKFHGVGGVFAATATCEQGDGTLASVEGLKYLIRPFGLIPEYIARMIRPLLILGSGLVAVKNRTAERRARHGIAVAPPRAMAAGEDELEFPRARLPEQRHRRPGLEALALGILDHLAHHCVGVFRPVQRPEYLADQILLISRERLVDRAFRDHPIVIHLGAQRMFEIETKIVPLGGGQRAVQLRCQRF